MTAGGVARREQTTGRLWYCLPPVRSISAAVPVDPQEPCRTPNRPAATAGEQAVGRDDSPGRAPPHVTANQKPGLPSPPTTMTRVRRSSRLPSVQTQRSSRNIWQGPSEGSSTADYGASAGFVTRRHRPTACKTEAAAAEARSERGWRRQQGNWSEAEARSARSSVPNSDQGTTKRLDSRSACSALRGNISGRVGWSRLRPQRTSTGRQRRGLRRRGASMSLT